MTRVVTPPSLVDREEELAGLELLLDGAGLGAGGALVVEAGAGMGKSRLLAAAVERAARDGMEVVTAGGSELERSFAYGVVRQLFERRVAEAPADERTRLLAGAAALAAPVLTPAPGGPDGDPEAVVHGLFWLAVNASAPRPLLLAVDDAHWADPPSLRWLAYLARRLEGLPVALVVATRPVRVGEHADGLRAIAAAPGARTVRPRTLGPEAVATLVREVLSPAADEAFCAACRAACGGNPFLLRELLAELERRGTAPTAAAAPGIAALAPATVERSVLARLGRLGPAAVALAEAAAILGGDTPLRTAAELAGLDLDAASEAADALVEAEVLRGAHPVGFAHPLVRSAVLTGIAPARRGLAHARAAQLLRRDGAPLDEQAAHLLHGLPAGDPAVVADLRAAAAQALGRGAPDAAIVQLRRALAEPPAPEERGAVLLELGEAEARARVPSAAARLADALARTPDPRAAGRVAARLATELMRGERTADAVAALDRALDDARGADPDLELELQALRIAIAWQGRTTQPRCRELVAALPSGLPGRTPAERAVLVQQALRMSVDAEDAASAADVAERALELGLLADQTSEGIAFKQAANVVARADRLDRALLWYDRALADARSRGSRLGAAVVLCHRSSVALRRGRVVDAETDARESLQLVDEPGWQLRPAALAHLADALVERDQLDDAAAALALIPEPIATSESFWMTEVLDVRGRLQLERGDPRAALDDLLACGRRHPDVPNPAFAPWRSHAALAHRLLGEPEEALRLAGDEVALARRSGAPRALGIALRARGLVAEGEERLAYLREAVDVLRGEEADLEAARALVDLGGALRRCGRRADGRALLADGLELAHACGARRLERRARQELRAAGGRPRTPLASGQDALTASERRVAEHAARGRSNAEIAQALFVTVKTVEMHLTGVYRKLGIASRAELASALT